MAEIQGSLINFKVRVNGAGGPFKTLICTEDSQFDINNEVTVRRTNCGPKASVAELDFSASGNAVFDYEPSASQVSWDDIKTYQKNKTKLDFQYVNEADTGLLEAEAVSAMGSGYFTATSLTASAESDGIGSFSWTFTGTGTLDSYDA